MGNFTGLSTRTCSGKSVTVLRCLPCVSTSLAVDSNFGMHGKTLLESVGAPSITSALRDPYIYMVLHSLAREILARARFCGHFLNQDTWQKKMIL